MKISNLTRNSTLAEQAGKADSFISRGRGLMFSAGLAEGSGLLIEPCNSIHMFFMRFPLDIVFADREGRVLFLYRGIKPWRMGRLVWGARCALELPVGAIDNSGTQVGDTLQFS